MSTQESLKDHTGKPSMKRKLALRAFIAAQLVTLFYILVAVYAIISGEDVKSYPMLTEAFFSFLGFSLICLGFNIPEYFSKLSDRK